MTLASTCALTQHTHMESYTHGYTHHVSNSFRETIKRHIHVLSWDSVIDTDTSRIEHTWMCTP